jgi:hypothetical protein
MSFHEYRINEIFSNADGTVQFIELTVGNHSSEGFWQGHSITVLGETTHTFTFPSNLPNPTQTANTTVLIATEGFAALGIVTPNYIVPDGFLFTAGGTIDFAGVDSVVYGQLPSDGTHAVNAAGTVVTATPRNFAGVTGDMSSAGNHAPTGTVTIEGTAAEGSLLTAQTGAIADADGLGPFSHQWLREGDPIGSATGSTYLLTQADVGFNISVRVQYTDGGSTLETLTSSETAEVANVNVEPTGAVVITGSTGPGLSITADTSALADADGLGALSYQWLREEEPIVGANASTYLLVAQDVNMRISVRVEYTDGGSTLESVTSATVGPVPAVADVTAPTVEDFSPDDGATGVTLSTNIVVTFSEDIARGTGTIVLKNDADVVVETYDAATNTRLQMDGAMLIIDPSDELLYHTGYKVEFSPGSIKDKANNGYAGSTHYDFETMVHFVMGTEDDDLIIGFATDDEFHGQGGNDKLDPGLGGEDTLDGGAGVDTAILYVGVAGILDYYREDSNLHLVTATSVIEFIDMERLQLSDLLAAFDTHEGESVWQAQALLWALTGEAAGTTLLSEWVHEADGGAGIDVLAQTMLDYYAPGLGTEVFVRHLFNINGAVEPSQDTVDFIVSQVGAGQTFENNGELFAYAATQTVLADRLVGFTGSVVQLDAAFFI